MLDLLANFSLALLIIDLLIKKRIIYFVKNYARAGHFSIAHLEPNQIPNMELFQKSVYGFKPFLISTESFILDV